jgi:hypothetical protein
MKIRIIKGKSINYGGQRDKEFKKKMMESKGREIKLAEEKSKQEKEEYRAKCKVVSTQAIKVH